MSNEGSVTLDGTATIMDFKLITGEELIAKCIYTETDVFKIKDPLTLMIDNTGQVRMIPSLFFGKTNNPMFLQKSAIILSAPAKDDVVEKYIETTSGIVIPQKRIITE